VLHAEALRLEQRGDRATGVVLDTGLLLCDAVVIATGPWCDWHAVGEGGRRSARTGSRSGVDEHGGVGR
jgi:glycine/D-amino acid oxidase-like deaminating enzyme